MKVAIVGSRDYTRLETVHDYLKELLKQFGGTLVIISGGADGPDRTAEEWAKTHSVPCEIFLPEDAADKKSYLKRNTLIVDAADLILAFWDGRSSGTLDTLIKASKRGKKFQVFLA